MKIEFQEQIGQHTTWLSIISSSANLIGNRNVLYISSISTDLGKKYVKLKCSLPEHIVHVEQYLLSEKHHTKIIVFLLFKTFIPSFAYFLFHIASSLNRQLAFCRLSGLLVQEQKPLIIRHIHVLQSTSGAVFD